MKPFFLFALAFAALSCGQDNADVKQLQARADSLQHQLDHAYKPGLGEFMLSVQVHHAKLWFAGEAQNWDLAQFEIEEIKEALDDIKVYCADRPEVKSLPMIEPALDSITVAIKQQKSELFNSSFALLTNSCNGCHHATHHEFNVIKVPDTPPYSNQVFKRDIPANSAPHGATK